MHRLSLDVIGLDVASNTEYQLPKIDRASMYMDVGEFACFRYSARFEF